MNNVLVGNTFINQLFGGLIAWAVNVYHFLKNITRKNQKLNEAMMIKICLSLSY